MILFKQEHVAPILEGRKTQTRRTGKRRWKVGNAYFCCTGYKKDKMFARVRVVALRQEHLGDMSDSDARAEGYSCAADMPAVFERIYKKPFDPNVICWVVTFELIEKVREAA